MADPCPPILKPSDLGLTIATSDVTLFDGNFTCNPVPPNSSLNDVLEILDAAICSIVLPTTINATNVTYTGTLVYSCFTLTGSDAETIIEEIATELCNVSSSLSTLETTVDNLCTTDIDLCGFVAADYECAFGTASPPELLPPNDNLTSLLKLMLARLCKGRLLQDDGKSAGGLTGSSSQFLGYASDLKSIVTGIVGNTRDYTTDGGVLSTQPASFTTSFNASSYVVNGWGVDMDAQFVDVASTSDNYIDIREDGTYVLTSVPVGNPEPPVASTSYRLYKVVSDGSGVVSKVDRQTSYSLDGTTFTDDSILTRHITDLNVTGAKLEDIVAATSEGDASFYQITYDTKGRITSSINKVAISGLANGDVLLYDSGTTNWINSPVAGSILPAGTSSDTLRYNGAAWVASSILQNTGSNIGVGIPVGLPDEQLTLGYDVRLSHQLSVPSSFVGGAVGGGSLPANTFYYVVTAVDFDGGETVVSAEVSVGVDGVTTTAVDLTWATSPLAASYKVYRGVAAGVYTEAQTVTTGALTDTGAGWVATAAPSNTNIESYGWIADSRGIRIGSGDLSLASLVVNSGATKSFSVWSEAGYVAAKDSVIISDDPVVALAAFPVADAYGVNIDRSWDGLSTVRVINDGSGTSTSAGIFVGSQDGASGISGETVNLSYLSPTYVRSGAPTTGVNWYQNKGLLKTNNDVSSLIISVGINVGGSVHFEMNQASKMFLETGGSLGLGIDDTGATAVNSAAIFEIQSTSKGILIPRWTTAQQTANIAALGASEGGLQWFNTDTSQFMGWNGTAAVILG